MALQAAAVVADVLLTTLLTYAEIPCAVLHFFEASLPP